MSQQKSGAPMILGIIGFIANIPGLFCAAACGAVVTGVAATAEVAEAAEAIAKGSNSEAAELGVVSGLVGASLIIFTLIPMLLGFIGGFLGKSHPTGSAIVMLLGGIFLLIIPIISTNWFLGIGASICYIIGGVKALGNR